MCVFANLFPFVYVCLCLFVCMWLTRWCQAGRRSCGSFLTFKFFFLFALLLAATQAPLTTTGKLSYGWRCIEWNFSTLKHAFLTRRWSQLSVLLKSSLFQMGVGWGGGGGYPSPTSSLETCNFSVVKQKSLHVGIETFRPISMKVTDENSFSKHSFSTFYFEWTFLSDGRNHVDISAGNIGD